MGDADAGKNRQEDKNRENGFHKPLYTPETNKLIINAGIKKSQIHELELKGKFPLHNWDKDIANKTM
ncbi:MAG TPA: hypothetical protein VKJ65_04115, partial [Phycisphaerae bacterium]|nr:hypothetical protein [Phycisphaerae bacterium]